MDAERIIQIIDDKIQNCTDEFRDEILQRVLTHYKYDTNSITKLVKFIKMEFKFAPRGKHDVNYWLCRGHSDDAAIAKSFDVKKGMKKRITVYNVEYWTSKINPMTNLYYTLDEAEYERNSIRPIKKEYWLKKGYSLNDAIDKAILTKKSNNMKGSSVKNKTSINNNKTTDYWLVRGYDEESAKNIISNNQSTFSLEKCVEKYGEYDGRDRWIKRQEKWQKSLHENNDMYVINKSKCVYSIMIGKEKDDIVNFLLNLGYINPIVCLNLNDFLCYVKKMILENPYYEFCSAEYVFNKIKMYVYYFIQMDDYYLIEFIKYNINFKINEKFKYSVGKITSYRMYTDEGYYLRSSNEISFYLLCNKYDIEFIYESCYTNSSLKYDFYLPSYDIYVEIAGLLNDNEYYQSMLYKQNMFGSVILKPEKINIFIEEILNGSFNRSDYRLL